jgi:hypothetical protein
MATSYLSTRTLDVQRITAPSMSETDVEAMAALLRRLSYSTMGKRLLEVALVHELQLSFASSWSLWRPARGMRSAQYSPGRRRVRLGRSHPVDVQLAALAHELQHFCDEVLGWGQGWTIDSEVRAQQSEALVIRELGLAVRSHSLDEHRRLLPRAALATRLRALRMYADHLDERPRPNGALHPLASNEELQRAEHGRAALVVARAPVLIVGPRTKPRYVTPVDTMWCP